MPLRVIFFNRSFYPDITATSQLLTELCEDLVNEYRCQVTVIAGRPLITNAHALKNAEAMAHGGQSLIQRERFKGIDILRVKSSTFSPRYFTGRICNYLTYFFLSFIVSFRLSKADIVVTLTDPPIIGLLGWLVCRRFNIPFVVSVRDIFPQAAAALSESRSKIMYFFLERISRFCLRRAKCIVALGELMRKRLLEKGISSSKIFIISDWADCSAIFPVAKRNSFSLAHNLSDFFVVMYSGNLGASSGLETLIDAAHMLKDYRDIIFVVIGEGIRKSCLIKRVKHYGLENVKFFSYQPRQMLPYSFSSADVFVLLLKKGLGGYSLPSKIYSILASGRPYVASVEGDSEVAGITYRFDCGLVAQPQDAQDLAKKIVFFYQNEQLRVRMGQNARRAAVFFTRGSGVKAYYELFKRLLGDKKDF
jgi:glycosyltransferase involved in cell wall biosynthesis